MFKSLVISLISLTYLSGCWENYVQNFTKCYDFANLTVDFCFSNILSKNNFVPKISIYVSWIV